MYPKSEMGDALSSIAHIRKKVAAQLRAANVQVTLHRGVRDGPSVFSCNRDKVKPRPLHRQS
jgi:hypothetical protein